MASKANKAKNTGCPLFGACAGESCAIEPLCPAGFTRALKICMGLRVPRYDINSSAAAIFLGQGNTAEAAVAAAQQLFSKNQIRFAAVVGAKRRKKERIALLNSEGFHLISYRFHKCMLFFVILSDRKESAIYTDFGRVSARKTNRVRKLLDAGYVALGERGGELLLAKPAKFGFDSR